MKAQNSVLATRTSAQVMIVDDHPIVREGLAALLAGHPDLAVTALVEDIPQAMRQIKLNPPDVAVIDLSLKDENGLDLIRWVREHCKSVRILVVSMHDENLFGERVLAAGAMGYLNKQTASRKIVDAIRQILDGRIYVSDELSVRLRSQQQSGSNPTKPLGIASLTDRELQVFSQIGAGLTTVQIAAQLHLSVKTVETHRQKIKGKLNLHNAAELSREAARWVLLNR